MGQKRKPEKVVQQPFKKPKVDAPTSKYHVEPRPDWHAAPTDHSTTSTVSHELALRLLQEDNDQYAALQKQKSSQSKFLNTIMADGTMEDRISALTLLIQEAPLHNMRALESLISLAKKKSRSQSLMALAALKDLFGQGAILPERKLKTFVKQEQNAAGNTQGALWAYEDWLKKKYFEVIQILEERCNDEVEYSKSRALTYVWELLKDKPEQEENLLRLVIHKLNDSGKVASRSSYLLIQLQSLHPAMKQVIINAISEYLLRPGQAELYYGLITLNQTVLSQNEQDVANSLLELYFTLFVQLLKTKEDENQARDKLLSQLLTGVNRAHAFADIVKFDQQIDLLFQVTHSANFNTAVQALSLLQRINPSDRFYRTLYESLLDPRLATSSKQTIYLNLLYKSLRADVLVNVKRVQAFVKRLLQILSVHEAPFICSVLYLVSELAQSFPAIARMVSEPEMEADDDEEHFHDVPEDDVQVLPTTSRTNGTTLRYDPRKRDPVHAHAELTALWEAIPSAMHFHPSVAVLASGLLKEPSKLLAKPDPATHTLLHFLDKFMYRTPKTKASHGTSVMQPSAASAAADLLIKPAAAKLKPVNVEAFWEKQVQDVAPEDVFFHSYFNQASNKTRKSKQKKAAAHADSDDSEAGEDEIWSAIASSRPEVEGIGDDDDDDLSIGDLESAYSDSDSEGGIDLGGEDGLDLDGDSDVPELDVDSGEELALDSEDDEAEEEKPETKPSSKKRSKKLKHLPTFASAEDYAKLLADEPDDL